MADTKYNEFVGMRDRIDAVITLKKRMPALDRAGKDSAYSEIAKFAYDFQAVTADRPDNADKLSAHQVESGVEAGVATLTETSANLIKDSLDDILKDMPENNLEALLGVPEVTKNIDSKHALTIEAYRGYKGLNEFLEAYQSGKRIDPKLQPMIISAAAKGRADAAKAEKAHLSKQLQNYFASRAATEVREGDVDEDKIKKYAVPGLEAQVKEAQTKYEDAVKANGPIYDPIRASVKKIATEKIEVGAELIYRAAKGKLGSDEED